MQLAFLAAKSWNRAGQTLQCEYRKC